MTWEDKVSAGAPGVVETVPVPTGQKLLDSLAETWDLSGRKLPTLQAVFYSGAGERPGPGEGAPPPWPSAPAHAAPLPRWTEGSPPPQDPRKT